MKRPSPHEVMGLVIFQDGGFMVVTGCDREMATDMDGYLDTIAVTDVLDAIMEETERVRHMNLTGFAPTASEKIEGTA